MRRPNESLCVCFVLSFLVSLSSAPSRLTFRPRHRLAHARQFAAVYGARMRKVRGPLIVYTRPNALDTCRLGLSIGRRIGSAVIRNTIKRQLREAFRLSQFDLAPRGYDIVIAVLPHKPLPAREYRETLKALVRTSHEEWLKRERRHSRAGQAPRRETGDD